MKQYCIYMHISPSGKKYIGQTMQTHNLNIRWGNGNGYKRQTYFYHAIQKYGWDNFEHKIIESGLPIEEVDAREKYWIEHFKSNQKQYGYNLTSGGRAERVLNETALLNIMDAHALSQGKSVICLDTGKIYKSIQEASRDTSCRRQAIIDCCKGKQFSALGLHWCFFNTPWTPEQRAKKIQDIEQQKREMQQRPFDTAKPIRCIETNEIYRSKYEAAQKTGIHVSCIKGCLKGKQKTAGKMHWEYIN